MVNGSSVGHLTPGRPDCQHHGPPPKRVSWEAPRASDTTTHEPEIAPEHATYMTTASLTFSNGTARSLENISRMPSSKLRAGAAERPQPRSTCADTTGKAN